MSPSRLRTRRLLIAAAFLAGLTAGGATHGQPPDEDEPETVPAEQPQFMISDDNFYMWIFGGGRNPDSFRGRFDSLLTLQLDDIDRVCKLDETQRAKLWLAGRGDLKRFFDAVAEKKRLFDKVKTDQNKLGEIFQEIQPLQARVNAGMFNEDSILFKTVKKTLKPPQTARYQRHLQDKLRLRYWAKVEWAVATLDNFSGLTADQRRRLVEVLMAETKPPRRFGQYDQQVVMLQAARLPEGKLRPMFDDGQWRVVKQHLDQARAMEQFIVQGGFLPAAPAAAPADQPAGDTAFPANVFSEDKGARP